FDLRSSSSGFQELFGLVGLELSTRPKFDIFAQFLGQFSYFTCENESAVFCGNSTFKRRDHWISLPRRGPVDVVLLPSGIAFWLGVIHSFVGSSNVLDETGYHVLTGYR